MVCHFICLFSFLLQNRDAQSLLPLTVKQINDAFQSSDDKSNLVVDGVDINTVRCLTFLLFPSYGFWFVASNFLTIWAQVTLVGRLCNKVGRISDITFVLDDGTGRIDCIRWWILLNLFYLFFILCLFLLTMVNSCFFAGFKEKWMQMKRIVYCMFLYCVSYMHFPLLMPIGLYTRFSIFYPIYIHIHIIQTEIPFHY